MFDKLVCITSNQVLIILYKSMICLIQWLSPSEHSNVLINGVQDLLLIILVFLAKSFSLDPNITPQFTDYDQLLSFLIHKMGI